MEVKTEENEYNTPKMEIYNIKYVNMLRGDMRKLEYEECGIWCYKEISGNEVKIFGQ